jgi:hypothetical protein
MPKSKKRKLDSNAPAEYQKVDTSNQLNQYFYLNNIAGIKSKPLLNNAGFQTRSIKGD